MDGVGQHVNCRPFLTDTKLYITEKLALVYMFANIVTGNDWTEHQAKLIVS